MPLRIQGGEAYLRRILENRVLTSGDFIEIPIMGRKIVLMVTGHIPKAEAVLVRDTTTIEIRPNIHPVESILIASKARRIPKVTWMPQTTDFGVIFAIHPIRFVAARISQMTPIENPDA